MHRSVCALSIALGFVILSGCTPAAPPPVSSAPVPSVPVCEPLDGATPYPCTQADFDAIAEQRALYEEAVGAFERYRREIKRQEVDWRLRELTPELEATTTGAFRGYALNFIERDRQDEARLISDPAGIGWIKPVLGSSKDGSIVAARVCVDARTERYLTKSSSTPAPGVATEHTYYFVREDSLLKITNSESERVESC